MAGAGVRRVGKRPSKGLQSCCEIIDQKREPITLEEFRKMMRWTYSDHGQLLATAWEQINDRFFNGVLHPCPILLPTSPPYGHWIGLCTGNVEGETVHIQLKRDMTTEDHVNVLLHECLHAYLRECGLSTDHNDVPWCSEIMRLSKQIWGADVWASPSVPRRVNGIMKRIQKPRSDGKESIGRDLIAKWPHSIGLSLADADGFRELLAIAGSK